MLWLMGYRNAFLLVFFTLINSSFMNHAKYTMLCLGDSYTIGESVAENERFAEQAVQMLLQGGITFKQPEIIAKTGWTTDELALAIEERGLKQKFDFVTLLIGVNNQYRGRDLENYRAEFKGLLETAIQYAGGNSKHIIVISIPDWGATPFVSQDPKHRSAAQIAAEIDAFNAIGKEEAVKAHAHFIDITPHSRKATSEVTLVANDGLHPSGKMYSHWATELSNLITKIVQH